MNVNIYLLELTCGHVKATKVRSARHHCQACGGVRTVAADRGTATYWRRR